MDPEKSVAELLTADGCGSYLALFLGLAELVRNVRRHVFLENEVMFPMAKRLEAQPA